MHNIFYSFYSFFRRKKFLAISIAITFIVIASVFASKLAYEENITKLIPSSEASDVTAKVLSQVNFADKITIMVSAEEAGADSLTVFARELLDSLSSQKHFIKKIQGQVEEENIAETYDFVYNNLPLFLDREDYEIIEKKLSPDSIKSVMQTNYHSLVAPTGIVSRDYILRDPLGIAFIGLRKLQQLGVGDDFVVHNGFLLTKDKKKLLLFITPKLATNETDQNSVFIEKLQSIMRSLNAKYSNKVAMNYFGATPVAVANATQIKLDVQNTSIFASTALFLLLLYFYRNLLTPFIIFVPSVFGALFTLSVLYFSKGTISIIAVGISAILLGETTDYSIYVMTHLREKKDVKLLFRDVTKPLLLCGATTAISFLCLFFIKSDALQDLAMFAALSVSSTAVFSLLIIPLLYKGRMQSVEVKANYLDAAGKYPFHKNKVLVGGIIVALLLSFIFYDRVSFNNDLSALNYFPDELKNAEKELEDIGNVSTGSVVIASYGDNYEEVTKHNRLLYAKLSELKQEGAINSFSSVGGILLPDEVQRQKLQQWRSFWARNGTALVKQRLISSGLEVGFKENTFENFYNTLDKNFSTVSVGDYKQVKALFLDEFIAAKDNFYTVTTMVKVPVAKRSQFVSEVRPFENLIVIDRQQTNETFLATLKDNFANLIDYSFIAIAVILFWAFRRVELVIISLIPILASWIITLGVMGLFGLQFNIINIIVCTLIFGVGVDYSLFMTAALQRESTYGKQELHIYRSSIIMSVATTVLGIGVLIFAKHPALYSISTIALTGIIATLLITFTLQPLAYNFIVTNRIRSGRPPYEIKKLIHSSLSFTYYGLGGFLLSIFSVAIMKLLPISHTKKLNAFHYLMSKFMHSVLASYPSVRRRTINHTGETFKKPAVIIANHSSFLDILAIGMLSPKIIFLVSDWVYNSPIFGKGVRLAGFYPVSAGIDNGIEHLREKVAQGFSLMVFPEGTRSENNVIKRFHKGAFYLAEQLSLDIIPIVIHGYSEVLPKGDFIINGGQTTLNILNRIKPDDPDFGADYATKAKKISGLFKKEYQQLRDTNEGPLFFNKTVLNGYAYREAQIVRQVRKDITVNATLYFEISKIISDRASIVHIADDYGQSDALLALRAPNRKISTYITDDEQASVARNNHFALKYNIKFIDVIEAANLSADVLLVTAPADILFLKQLMDRFQTIIFANVSPPEHNGKWTQETFHNGQLTLLKTLPI